MSYVIEVIAIKKKLRNEIGRLLSEEEAKASIRDHHAKRPPRPCGLTIHPGVGCVYACRYCYIYDMGFEERTRLNPLTGLQLVYALLSNKYFIPGNRGTYLAIGSITEPFHPLLKEKTLEYIHYIYKWLGNPTQFSTKMYIDSFTAKKIAELSGNKISPLITVVTLAKHSEIEPKSPSPGKRFEAMKNLREAGLKPFLFLRPLIPGLVEKEYREIVDLAVDHGAVGVVAGTLRVTKNILNKLREVGVDTTQIEKRVIIPIDKMKNGVQYDVYTRDIKKDVELYVRKQGLIFYSSACMANLYTHGLRCWKMYLGERHVEVVTEIPEISEVREITRRLGGEVIDVKFEHGILRVGITCKHCDKRLIGEFLRSRYLVCTKIYRARSSGIHG